VQKDRDPKANWSGGSMIEPYQAVMVQARVTEPGDVADFERVVRKNAWRQILLFRRFKFSYGRVKLVMVTEHCMHGLDASGNRERVRAMGLAMPTDRPVWEVPGAEIMAMYALAANELNLFVAGSSWEIDPNWPDLCFHTGFVISPEGKIILKTRHANSGLGAASTSGMYTRLVDTYGYDSGFGPFPVVDTEIGKLGFCIGGDILQPEAARVVAQKGAEIILHPQGERNMESTRVLTALRRTMAFQNKAYVISTNIGQYQHQNFEEAAPPNDEIRDRVRGALNWGEFEFMGRSQIVDFNGDLISWIPSAGESATGALIDIERLRYERQLASRSFESHLQAYAHEYANFPGAPMDWEFKEISRFKRQKETMSKLVERGIFHRSEAYGGDVGGGMFAEMPALAAKS
jgi:predicted amidohydrolase